MWRAFFLAIGISLVIIGAQCLVVDRVVLASSAPGDVQQNTGLFGSSTTTNSGMGGRELTPPDWAPWSLMATGAVVIIYSFTVPKRVAG
jgi:hypothetical protein